MTASGPVGRDNGQADPLQGQKELTWPKHVWGEDILAVGGIGAGDGSQDWMTLMVPGN